MPLLKKARSTNTPRFLDYLVTWQSEFARVPPRAQEPLNTGTLGTRLVQTGHVSMTGASNGMLMAITNICKEIYMTLDRKLLTHKTQHIKSTELPGK
jgi:hypothetical protein